jgi:hypothetical protein
MGDIVSLVEKAAATIDAEKAARVAERMRKGQFDLSDLREQLIGMQQMGGMAGLMGMMPGIAKMKNQLAAANLDERVLKRQMAIIDSMTSKERKTPDVLKASRKKRIAAGSGTKVEDVNRMLKVGRNAARWPASPTCSASAAAACRARSRCRNSPSGCRAARPACRAMLRAAAACRPPCLVCRRNSPAARCSPASAAASYRASVDFPDWERRNEHALRTEQRSKNELNNERKLECP